MRVARKVLDHTKHTLLVGEKATQFAETFGKIPDTFKIYIAEIFGKIPDSFKIYIAEIFGNVDTQLSENFR